MWKLAQNQRQLNCAIKICKLTNKFKRPNGGRAPKIKQDTNWRHFKRTIARQIYTLHTICKVNLIWQELIAFF